MDIYFAGANRAHLVELLAGESVDSLLIGWRTLGGQFERLLPLLRGRRLLLDPGYGTGGRPEEYLAWAREHAELFDGCLAWDVPGGGWLTNTHWFVWCGDVGLPRMVPVFHPGMPWRFLGAMQTMCGRVALGGLLRMPLPTRLAYLDALWYLPDGSLRTPGLVAHGLGQDHPAVLARYPWASVDSTTWLNPLRYGKGGQARAEIRRMMAKAGTPWRPPGQPRLVVDWAAEVLAAGAADVTATMEEATG